MSSEEGRWESFSYWILNIIEQNKQAESIDSLLPVLEKALSGFLMQRYHETLTPELAPQLLKIIYDYCSYVPSTEKVLGELDQRKHPKLKVRGLLWRD